MSESNSKRIDELEKELELITETLKDLIEGMEAMDGRLDSHNARISEWENTAGGSRTRNN